jgi:hypothetical protein
MPVENFSRDSVQTQANAIVAYWNRRGYRVSVSVVPIIGDKKKGPKTNIAGWEIETDMVNGLPLELYTAKVNAARGAPK